MTEQQFVVKVANLAVDIDRLITEKANELVISGAIKFEEFNNDYYLPKLFMVAISKNIGRQYQSQPPNNVKIENDIISSIYSVISPYSRT
jgi:hypothetical protein